MSHFLPCQWKRLGAAFVCLVLCTWLHGEALAQAQTGAYRPPRATLGAPVATAAAPQWPAMFSLADLQNMALSSNPTIGQADAGVGMEQGLYKQVGLYPNPTVGYVRTDPDKSGESATQGIFLSQTFITGGKLRLARAIERADIDKRIAWLNAQQQRVLNDVKMRFYDVLGAQRKVATARELVRMAEEGVNIAKQLLKAKQVSRADVLQTEIQLNAVRITLHNALYHYQAAWKQLTAVVGRPDLPPTLVAGDLEAGIPELNWQQSLQELMARSPILQAQNSEIQADTQAVLLAKRQAIPNVNVQVVAQRDRVKNYSSVSTLIALPLPIFNRNQGGVMNAVSHLREQQTEYNRLQMALIDQLSVSFQKYLSVRNQIQRLKKDILPRAKENLDLTTKAYKLGQFDVLRVLNARQTYFETHLAYLDALTEIHKAATEIKGLQLTGGLNPTTIGTALQAQPGIGMAGLRGILLQQLQQRGSGTQQLLPGALQATGGR